MTNNDEFDGWISLSDMLLGAVIKLGDESIKIVKRTPDELECALEKNNWFYCNSRGRIMRADAPAREHALNLLATYNKKNMASINYPHDFQPPSDWLNTDNDPGLASFRWRLENQPNFEKASDANAMKEIKIKQMWAVDARKLAENYIKQWRAKGFEPTVENAALYVEGVFSTRGTYNTRGNVIDRETIRKEALVGVTGKPKGYKSKFPKIPVDQRGKLPEK